MTGSIYWNFLKRGLGVDNQIEGNLDVNPDTIDETFTPYPKTTKVYLLSCDENPSASSS